jgi:UrcA family protein
MTSVINKTAMIALYAVAALPFVAISFAHAEPVTVKVSDLNMSQPAQVQQYDQRVDRAARQICATYSDPRDLDRTAACKTAVRAEAADKLNQAQSMASR